MINNCHPTQYLSRNHDRTKEMRWRDIHCQNWVSGQSCGLGRGPSGFLPKAPVFLLTALGTVHKKVFWKDHDVDSPCHESLGPKGFYNQEHYSFTVELMILVWWLGDQVAFWLEWKMWSWCTQNHNAFFTKFTHKWGWAMAAHISLCSSFLQEVNLALGDGWGTWFLRQHDFRIFFLGGESLLSLNLL